jgi:hypothetical protein
MRAQRGALGETLDGEAWQLVGHEPPRALPCPVG